MKKINSPSRHIISYSIGFLSSIILTVIAYAVVVHDVFTDFWSPAAIAIILAVLASLQLVIQLLFFLHLGDEEKPRWKLLSFIFAFIILGIVVFGSLWIMFDLNARMMMSPEDMIKYMNRQTGL
ncbi:MAG: cyoD [Candidatus Saccharibacteria bacterium]|jgi:cytochrome o ubiquinol oxidase operon protein cyoD|nr:cyoD [Candidatus Saccharibacteria bacterium]